MKINILYGRGVRSFFEQADSLFLISYPAHMQKLIQYGMTYTFIRIAITNVVVVVVVAMLPVLMKSIGVTKIQLVLFGLFFTVFRFLLALLTRFIHVRVGKRWLLWIIKNVIFSTGLSFFGLSLFFINKNPFYSILCIGLAVFLIIILIKEKLNYKNCFFNILSERSLLPQACERR